MSGQVDKEMRWNGLKKSWWHGQIMIAGYKDDKLTASQKYELQQDHTHTLFHYKYDEEEEEIEKKEISKGHKIV